jgi:hypothetical protein
MGISPEDIMRSTRLTEDEIRCLQTAETSERKNCH